MFEPLRRNLRVTGKLTPTHICFSVLHLPVLDPDASGEAVTGDSLSPSPQLGFRDIPKAED